MKTTFSNSALSTATEKRIENNSGHREHWSDRTHPHSPSLKDVRPFPLAHFKRYESLSSEHSGLWRIKSGYIRTLTWNIDGEFVPLGFWTAGDTIDCTASGSFQSAIAGPLLGSIAQTHPYEAQCLTTVAAEYLGNHYTLPKETILAQLSQSNDLLRIAHCHQTELRLLLFVCWLAEKFGQPIPDGYQVDIKLTHQEIAESIGATRVTVSRLLKVLERKGKIRWTTRIKQVNRTALRECRAA